MNSVVSPNARQLVVARSVTHLDLLLSANSEDWKPRITALQDLEQLVSDGLQRDGYDAFSEAIAAPLHSLSSSLTVQVNGTSGQRSCGSAPTRCPSSPCTCPPPSGKCACKIFPAVLRVASGTNGVIRSYAAPAAEVPGAARALPAPAARPAGGDQPEQEQGHRGAVHPPAGRRAAELAHAAAAQGRPPASSSRRSPASARPRRPPGPRPPSACSCSSTTSLRVRRPCWPRWTRGRCGC